jgi:hypothetical protein
MTQEQAIAKWKSSVYDNAENIDPDFEMDWNGIAFGFFMGLGFSEKEAEKLEIRADNEGLV